jgi:hypothetical protein
MSKVFLVCGPAPAVTQTVRKRHTRSGSFYMLLMVVASEERLTRYLLRKESPFRFVTPYEVGSEIRALRSLQR